MLLFFFHCFGFCLRGVGHSSTRLSGAQLIFSLDERISSHHCPPHLPAQFNPLMNAIITQSFTEGCYHSL